MTRLVIARHGNTFAPGDIVTRVGGRTDLPLVASGRAQGEALGRHFAALGISFAAAFCSPLARTRQSAELILAQTGNDIEPASEAFLTEIDYGPDENRPEDEVRARKYPDAYGSLWGMACASDTLDPAVLDAGEVDRRLATRAIRELQHFNGAVHCAQFALPNHLRVLLA